MFQRTKICSGLLLAFGGAMLSVAPGAFAQDTTVQRVEITGSSIKRVDAETSVPVTVITADELKKAGVTSVEQGDSVAVLEHPRQAYTRDLIDAVPRLDLPV